MQKRFVSSALGIKPYWQYIKSQHRYRFDLLVPMQKVDDVKCVQLSNSLNKIKGNVSPDK
jgi:hypothetical protein